MKIGIIGCGHIGSILARLWAQAGHEVILSCRHMDRLPALAKSIGPKAIIGTPEDAARLGDVVLLSIPLGEIPKLSRSIQEFVDGKIVMDTCNPYPERDKEAGVEALHAKAGSGVWVAKHLPEAVIVKAFNTIHYKTLESEAHRKTELVGVPLASDDSYALQKVSGLVKDAGFDPVIVGELKLAKEFDNGTPPYASGATAKELKQMFCKKE